MPRVQDNAARQNEHQHEQDDRRVQNELQKPLFQGFLGRLGSRVLFFFKKFSIFSQPLDEIFTFSIITIPQGMEAKSEKIPPAI